MLKYTILSISVVRLGTTDQKPQSLCENHIGNNIKVCPEHKVHNKTMKTSEEEKNTERILLQKSPIQNMLSRTGR